jgi:hypothetical protein
MEKEKKQIRKAENLKTMKNMAKKEAKKERKSTGELM